MNSDWDLPSQQESIIEVASRRIKEVLIEYDTPQAVLLTDGRSEYFALAVDEDEAVSRWLQVPMSGLESAAFLAGARPIREVLRKPRVTVVDVDHQSTLPLRAWRVEWVQIPEAVLPHAGVRLPLAVAAQVEVRETPVLRVVGFGAANSGATLPQLSAVVGTLHELWTAIVRNVMNIADPPQFSVYATARGSLELSIHADDMQLFGRVVSEYANLVRAVEEAESLAPIAKVVHPDIVAAYEKHLGALEKQHVEVLTQWRATSVFVGENSAEATRASERESDEPESTVRPVTHRGYFQGFWPVGARWRFSFFDVDANEGFAGKIGGHLKRDWGVDTSLVIGPGAERKYHITVATTFGPDPDREVLDRVLLSFSPTE